MTDDRWSWLDSAARRRRRVPLLAGGYLGMDEEPFGGALGPCPHPAADANGEAAQRWEELPSGARIRVCAICGTVTARRSVEVVAYL